MLCTLTPEVTLGGFSFYELPTTNVPGRQDVFGSTGLAQGENRIVLDQPQLIVGTVAASGGERLHGLPHRRERLPPKPSNDQSPRLRVDERQRWHRYSVHFTSGWARRATCAAS